MSSSLELFAAKAILGSSGQVGTMAISPIVANKIVTSVNMKVGAYTIAAQPVTPARLSVLSTAVAAADTMGTIDIVGTDVNGAAQLETITPISGTTVYSTKVFKTVTSATGVGWVINSTNDTIVIGVAGVTAPDGYYFSYLQIVAAAVAASQTAQAGFLCADLTTFASLPAGVYPTRLTSIALTSGTGILGLNKI